MTPTLTDGKEKRWSVYVDGTEVNDYYMDFVGACTLAEDYRDDGYEVVCVKQFDTGEEISI